MGTSSSSAELSAKLAASGLAVRTGMHKGVTRTAQGGKGTLEAAMVKAGLPASGKLRNMRGKFGVRYTVRPTGSSVNALLRVYGAAPYIFNEGAPKHPIVPRKGNARMRKGARVVRGLTGSAPTLSSGGQGVLFMPGIGFRKYVNHPGMKGRHWFRPTVPAVNATASKVIPREIAKAMASIYK